MTRMHGTTIVAVHKDGMSALAGDGQVTLGETIVKTGATKVRTLQEGGVIVGFAGAVSDAFTLLEKFEGQLAASKGNLLKAAVDTVKEWRTDRALRNLEAMLIVCDEREILTLSGAGDVVAPDHPVAAVGSGAAYAQAAAMAMLKHSDLSAAAIAEEAIRIAGAIDLYTSGTPTVLTVPAPGEETEDDA